MELIESVRNAWGWTGIKPEKVVGENDFGNLMVRDEDGKYWRLCPEELYCKVVAETRAALDALAKDDEFQQDWNMDKLVALASESVGPLGPGRKYCLKMPGVLGGQYVSENLASIALIELVEFAGYVAHQIEDLPDGTKVNFRFDTDA